MIHCKFVRLCFVLAASRIVDSTLRPTAQPLSKSDRSHLNPIRPNRTQRLGEFT